MMGSARVLATVGATAFVAFAAGHVIENGDETVARISASLEAPGAAQASIASDVPALPRPPIETLQATPFPTMRSWTGSQPSSQGVGTVDRGRYAIDHGLTCATLLNAAPMGEGFVRVTLDAPCYTNQSVTIRHEGLAFTEQTAINGRLTVDMPVLTSAARIEAVFQDGKSVSQDVTVPDADAYKRAALTWRGETGLHIHAHEFGAATGTAGHIWAGAPGRTAAGQATAGGYMTVLGDPSLMNANRAEVYTFPAEAHRKSGVVRLSVEAEVRNTNCGGIIAAQTLQPDGIGGVISSNMTLNVPECHAVGQYMVLKNILRDLKIASNQ